MTEKASKQLKKELKRRKKLEKKKIKLLSPNLKKYKRELKQTITNFELLDKYSLPKITNEHELIQFLNIDYLTLIENCIITKKVTSSQFPYRRFAIDKKTGGKRQILAPKKNLKLIQDKIYEGILKKIEPSEFAHGFRTGYSIVSNASVHLGAAIIYNLDLKNFFPSIKFYQVLKVFKDLGYSGRLASILSILCTMSPRKYLSKKNTWLLTRREYPYLPQGASTSPALSNLVAFNLDRDLSRIANEYGFKYSRYADDLTFSHPSNIQIDQEFRKKINRFVKKNKFRINFRKEKFSREFKQKKVTGINIHDDFLSLPRPWIRKLRAAIHELRNINLDTEDPYLIDLIKNIEGRCAFAHMVNKEKYAHLYETFKILKAQKLKNKE